MTDNEPGVYEETPIDVAIIGAGFAGMGAAIQIQERLPEHTFVIFEAASSPGGTWRDNTYPGCGCDVPSHMYSFSFEQNPDWSKAYSDQGEILEYIERVFEKYQLGANTRFDTRVVNAEFDVSRQHWVLTCKGGQRFFARYVIAATGPLVKPSYPNVPGIDSFPGDLLHTARWDHSVDLKNKRVAVVGTGASAIQLIPELAKKVDELVVLQRTPPWITPRHNRRYTDKEKARFRRFPFLQRAFRNAIYWRLEALALGLTQRPEWMTFVEGLAKKHIERGIRDPELRRKVTPSYRAGCKRILVSDDYYPALDQNHVTLIDEPLISIEANAVVTENTRHEVDAVVFGTGFAVTEFMAGLEVIGAEGKSLRDYWKERGGIEAYYGLCVEHFPNMFALVGPNTGLGHNSIVFMIEAQVHWIIEALRFVKRREKRGIDVKSEAQREFNKGLKERLAETVWQTGCQSWYLDESGHNFSLWPGFTFEYWIRTRAFQPEHFRLLE